MTKLSEIIQRDTLANRPAAGIVGRLYYATDEAILYRDSGLAWESVEGAGTSYTTPLLADYTWVNQETATASESGGGIHLLAPAQAGDDLRVLVKAAPVTPYTITTWFYPRLHLVDFNLCGLCFRQSSDGKIVTFHMTAKKIEVVKFDSPILFNATYLSVTHPYLSPVCLRIADDGTNRSCSWSTDGENFHTLHSVLRTDFLTADQVGFFANSVNATYPAAMTLLSWEEA